MENKNYKTFDEAYEDRYNTWPKYYRLDYEYENEGDYEFSFKEIGDHDFWTFFEVEYREIRTIDLIMLLRQSRKYLQKLTYYHDLKNKLGLWKIVRALKKELSKREHIPNSSERKKIRQQKAFDKKNR
jgi:hypothetical protein